MNTNNYVRSSTRFGSWIRRIIKRFIYSQLSLFTGIKIALGFEHPFIRFIVEKDPPSVYWVFRIKESAVENLAEKIGIPANFTLSQIKCLEDDEPAYLMVLNTYRVSGLTNSIRAEWSLFVQDESNSTRYMIVDARSAKRSMDPIDIITKPSIVNHERVDNQVITQIGHDEEVFRSSFTFRGDEQIVEVSKEWILANDFIYWLNGVRDHTFYNGGLAGANQIRINSNQAVIENHTIWSSLLEPEPMYILVLDHVIEFVISPWENIDRLKMA